MNRNNITLENISHNSLFEKRTSKIKSNIDHLDNDSTRTQALDYFKDILNSQNPIIRQIIMKNGILNKITKILKIDISQYTALESCSTANSKVIK